MTSFEFDIAILGAGSFGTAVAVHLARQNHKVILWGRNKSQINQMTSKHENSLYLPDIKLPNNLILSSELTQAVTKAKYLIIAMPSHAFADLISKLPNNIEQLCWLTKGIEPKTNAFLHEIVLQKYPKSDFAILAGPSFAKEVAKGMPTALTLASNNEKYSEELHSYLHSKSFRVYKSKDYIGVQLAGAMKNVLAIAVGVSDGLGYGANARAALITRGLNEMRSLGKSFKAQELTFMGLTGIGDLLLTATDNQSRNRRFGLALGSGKSPDDAAKEIGQVVEGRFNAVQVSQLGNQKNVDLPICNAVSKLINNEITAKEAVEFLLRRPATYE